LRRGCGGVAERVSSVYGWVAAGGALVTDGEVAQLHADEQRVPRVLERADGLVVHEAQVLALLEAQQRAQLAYRLLEVTAERAQLRWHRLK